jgi:hypothetical protein
MAGEVDGDALMRSSSPALPSSSAFRLRPVMAVEDGMTEEQYLRLVAGPWLVSWWQRMDILLRVGERRLLLFKR